MFEERYEDGDSGYYPVSVRTDERVIELFNEVGSKFASSSYAEIEAVTVSTTKDFYYASSEKEAYRFMKKELGIDY